MGSAGQGQSQPGAPHPATGLTPMHSAPASEAGFQSLQSAQLAQQSRGGLTPHHPAPRYWTGAPPYAASGATQGPYGPSAVPSAYGVGAVPSPMPHVSDGGTLLSAHSTATSAANSAGNSSAGASGRGAGPVGEEGYTGALLFDVPALAEGCRRLRALVLIVGVPHNQPNGLRSEGEVLEELSVLPHLEEVRPALLQTVYVCLGLGP